MATTPVTPNPQQQANPQGTAPPKQRRIVLLCVGILAIWVAYTVFVKAPAQTQPHKRMTDNLSAPTDAQINAARRANQDEIEAEKQRQAREQRVKDTGRKTEELQRKLAAPASPSVRSIGGLSRSDTQKRGAPSIVFDLTAEARNRGSRAQDGVPVNWIRQRGQAFDNEQRGDSFQEEGRQVVEQARRYSTNAPYQEVATKDPRESGREQYRQANLFPPDPDWETTTIPKGTVIEAVLINQLEGANDGPVEVMITSDVFQTGTHRLLFPQGTTVSGDTARVNSGDQERLAVAFHGALVELPDHQLYRVSLDSPALDQAGSAALGGKVDHHYWQIFGASLAVGAIGGLANIGNTYGGYGGYDAGSSMRSGFGSEMGHAAQQVMGRFLNRLPTIVIPEGTRVRIMLTADVPNVPFYPTNDEDEQRRILRQQ